MFSAVMYARCLLALSLSAAVAGQRILRRDQTLTTSKRDPTINQQFGILSQLTTVNPGVSIWLSGLGTHNFFGNLANSGQIIISQTDWLATSPAGGQTSDFVGHTATDGNVINNGSISLNDFGSGSAPTYDWYLRSMSNSGSMQWCGRGDTGGSTYQLYCDVTCYNYGVISFEQYNGNLGAAYVWRNAVLSPPGATNIQYTYNYGAFRIINVVYHNVQNVLGDGCYVIGSGGTLYLEDGSGYFQNPLFGPTFPNQKIYFTSTTATLHMDTQVYSHNPNFGPQLYGFGTGNAIEFFEVFSTTVPFVYTAATGILTVTFISGNVVNIKMGTGYTPSSFSTARHPSNYNALGYNAIFYSGAAPAQTIPGQCQVSLGACQNPANTAGVFPSTASSTTSVASATGFVTTTLAATGGVPVGTATSIIANPSGTAPGTIALVPIYASYNTVTLVATGSVTGSVTSTVVQAVGTTPGIVQIIPLTASAPTTSPTTTSSAALTSPTATSTRPATIATNIGSAQCICIPASPF